MVPLTETENRPGCLLRPNGPNMFVLRLPAAMALMSMGLLCEVGGPSWQVHVRSGSAKHGRGPIRLGAAVETDAAWQYAGSGGGGVGKD